MPKKIVLATIGSLGDVHPFIALGQSLKTRGFEPVLAVPKSNIEKAERAGLKAEAIFPSFEEMGAMLGMSEQEATGRMLRNPDFLIRRLMIRYLRDSAKALDAISQGASAIASSTFVFAAPIIAAARNIPLIPVILQPMTMMSPYDPPMTPDFWTMQSPPITPGKAKWNRFFLDLIGLELRRRYARPIDAVRRDYGLKPSPQPPVFPGPPADAQLVIGFYAEPFAPQQPDFPPNVILPGFPIFDSDSGAAESLDPELEAFLANGEPPLVFTLGTFAVYAPGDFYRESLAAARLLKRRAILLTGPGSVASAEDALVRSYVPHSLLFPRAAATIHHGGIGTTGAALRAGRPQLVVPHMGDQADHGARIERLGLGAMLPSRRYTAARAADILRDLLANVSIARNAEAFAPKAAANGAEATADAIVAALSQP